MIRKVSGAKSVIVPITALGRNPLPYVEYLNNRYIKYIDFVKVASLPSSMEEPVSDTSNMFVTLSQQSGNSYFIKSEPLVKFDIERNKGIRKPIMQKISLQNSFIECTDKSYIGQSVLLVFWYDLPEYSARNKTLNLVDDYFEVKILTNTDRIALPDNRTMVGRRFRNFLITYPDYTPSMAKGIHMDEAEHLYLTLQKGNYKVVDAVPLKAFYQIDKLQSIEFANIIFDFTSSFIFFGGSGLSSAIGKSVMINATYEQ
ncbi:MAG: hypothetical protein ACI30B_07580 [Paludibacteraceae bacterium]